MTEDGRPANDPADYFRSEKSWLLQSVAVGGGEDSGELVDILVEEGKIVRVEANIGVGGEVGLIAGEGRRVTPGRISMERAGEGEGEEGVTLMMEQLAASTADLQQKVAEKQSQTASTDFGLAVKVADIQDLHSGELEEAVSSGGLGLVSLSLTRLDNRQLLATFKRLAALGCAAQVWLDRVSVLGELRRAGLSPGCGEEGELEETEVRRVLTLARQVRLRLCIEQVNSLPALNLVKHFSQIGSQVFARPTESLLAQLREDQAVEAVEDVIISLHPSSSVKMSSTNPARFLGLHPRKGHLQPGADADLVIWGPDLSPALVMLAGQVVQAGGQPSPRQHGAFLPLPTIRPALGDVRRVERKEDLQRKEEKKETVKFEPSLVSEVQQVPGMFQRRVSAFGIRNQQDSTFNLTQPDCREQEQPHSLTGSRRASVKVQAPPGGLSSGFW